MAAQPSSDDIAAFTGITGLAQDVAIKYLKENNDLQSAINAYFEPPPQEQHLAWDESPFHADKTVYGPENHPQTSFNVHSPDTLNPSVFNNGAPSRPPSRISNRGANNVNSGQSQLFPSAERDDQNLQKALAISIHDTMSGQETGVTDAAGAHFGPATDAYYDNDKWAMTAAKTHAQEILQNPDPQYRVRSSGTPAFLKPSVAGHHIPSLITILHAIPMAREALLSRDSISQDYGRSDDWWDGMPIEVPKIYSLDDAVDEYDQEDIISESQRLMAFLDETERAYGSTDVLSNVAGMRQAPAWEVEIRFLELWSESISRVLPDFELRNIFRMGASTAQNNRPFYGINLNPEDELLDRGLTLYDALDDALWTGYRAGDEKDVYLNEVPEVLVIRIQRYSGKGSGLGIKIPGIWYADRYLKDSVKAARDMRSKKESLLSDIQKLEKSQARLATFTRPHSNGKSLDTRRLLSVAKSHFEATSKNHSAKGATQQSNSLSTDSACDSRTHAKIAEELQAVADRVDQKIDSLELAKEKAIETMRELSKLYTKPSEIPDEPPYHKYTLRGVSTNPNTTYVLVNPSTPGDLMESEIGEWQWWKIQYILGDARPISCTVVREVEVLKAARDESTRALLVYASENALLYPEKALPSVLKNFVRADNLAFETEIRKSSPKQTTPTKRKASHSYEDIPSAEEPNWGGYQDPYSVPDGPPMGPPPPYTRTKPPPPPPRAPATREIPRRLTSHDDTLPLTLDPTMDPKHMAFDDIDLLGDGDSGQEMKERNGGLGVVPGGTGAGVGEYALGSYEPEIVMEDYDDDGKVKAD
ncbi:hypothetical protein MMC13_005540 [Lambiella insularis]|nr:hypothetical protein [Lambiella insularis]